MAVLYKIDKSELELPAVRNVSLLTLAEFEEYEEYIDDAYANPFLTNYTKYFYLQDEANNGLVYVARFDDEECELSSPCQDDPGDEFWEIENEPSYGTGNRPVIRFVTPIPGAKPGDKIEIGYFWKFTVLAADIILLDTYISNQHFDDFTNVYEKSTIKMRVDRWFEEEIKRFII